MKKAKIMLTAVVIFAVVGGALAFKAKNFNHPIFTTDVAGPCTQTTSATTTDEQVGVQVYVTDIPGANCELFTYTTFMQ